MSPAYPPGLGRVFEDATVVRNYRYRQPYPQEIFEILEGLLVEPRTVLDAGSGTEALTIGMARFARRVDAVDPSAAMLREAPMAYEQSLDDYIAILGSRSSLSQTTLGSRADDFERGARALLARHSIASIRAELVGEVVWGRPR